MLFRTSLRAAAVALALAAHPHVALAQTQRPTIHVNDGLVFPWMNLIRFWETSGDQAMGASPSERAPGRIFRKPGVFVHGNVPKAQADLLTRKLTAALDILLAQIPLRDIHGSYLMSSINISRALSGQVQGCLSIRAFPINLADPLTRVDEGRYSTPGGEGPSLNVWYNAPLYDRTDRVFIIGEYDGIKIQPAGPGYAGIIVKSDRQFLVPGKNGNVLNPKFFDTSRPVGDLQLLWFHASSGYRDRQVPTGWNARLAAAGFMADWGEIVRKMEQTR